MGQIGPGSTPAIADAGYVDLALVRPWLTAWLASPALRALAELSGWPVEGSTLEADLEEIAARSADWDFRSGAERHHMTTRPAIVNGRELDEEVIVEAAAALGLIGGSMPTGAFTHVVVLGGMAIACRNRARFAHDLGVRLELGDVVVLTANRPLAGVELADVEEAGWGHLDLESQAAAMAAREVYRLPDQPDRAESGAIDVHGVPDTGVPDAAELERRVTWSHLAWDRPVRVDLVVVPSSDPLQRRATSFDQLRFWAQRAKIDRAHRLLIVTTAHYVPYTQMLALRALALPSGCALATVGTEWVPRGTYRGAAYLQEVRSALVAARDLLQTLRSP